MNATSGNLRQNLSICALMGLATLANGEGTSAMPEASLKMNWQGTVSPYASMRDVTRIGRTPSRHAKDIARSPLGIGYETLDRRTFDPTWTFKLVAEAGVKWARCQTGWIRCEREKGVYDFSWLDEVVDGLSAEGVQTWFSVSFGNPLYTPNDKFENALAKAKADGVLAPGWARGYVGEAPLYHGEEAMDGWKRYVRELARHFSCPRRCGIRGLRKLLEFDDARRGEEGLPLAASGSCAGDRVLPRTPESIRAGLDLMAGTGRPLHVSEVTIPAPGVDAKARMIQATVARNFYRACFSHKATMGITWWNTVDGGGYAGEPEVSGLLTKDLERKPVYDVLDELINQEWKTKCTVKAKGGKVAFRGFRGKYRLSWNCPECG